MSEAVDDDLVNNFQAITHASEANARMYLAAADSDLQNAIAMYFAGVTRAPFTMPFESPRSDNWSGAPLTLGVTLCECSRPWRRCAKT